MGARLRFKDMDGDSIPITKEMLYKRFSGFYKAWAMVEADRRRIRRVLSGKKVLGGAVMGITRVELAELKRL